MDLFGLLTMPALQDHFHSHHLNRSCWHCLCLPPAQLWLGMQWKFSATQPSIWILIKALLWLRINHFLHWPRNFNGNYLRQNLLENISWSYLAQCIQKNCYGVYQLTGLIAVVRLHLLPTVVYQQAVRLILSSVLNTFAEHGTCTSCL